MSNLERPFAATNDGARSFVFDGETVPYLPSDSIASALLRADVLSLRRSRLDEPRGIFCGIGVCNECLVTVGDSPNQRACLLAPSDGANVTTGRR